MIRKRANDRPLSLPLLRPGHAINDPSENKDNLLVSVCSYYDRCDKTCVLESGHEFIVHKSFISYFWAEVVETQVLIKRAREEVIRYEGLFEEEEFELVKEGFLKSRLTRPVVRQYFKNYCG